MNAAPATVGSPFKALVVSCLEPELLARSLASLLVHLAPSDVVVLNNGNRAGRTRQIDEMIRKFGVERLRLHDAHDGESTLSSIHRALVEVSRENPDDIVLKVDEDVLLDVGSLDPTKVGDNFYVPCLTINNLTTRWLLGYICPPLRARTEGHAWMFHEPHPATGEDLRLACMAAVYGTDPALLAELCRTHGDVEVLTGADWSRCSLMPDRGVSSTAIAFRGRMYQELLGRESGIEEILIARAVQAGAASYVVDYGAFGHHVNYWTMRPYTRANRRLVARYNERVRRVIEEWAVAGSTDALPLWSAVTPTFEVAGFTRQLSDVGYAAVASSRLAGSKVVGRLGGAGRRARSWMSRHVPGLAAARRWPRPPRTVGRRDRMRRGQSGG